MQMPAALAWILILAGVWTLCVWPPFLRRVWKDPRARDEQGGATRYLMVHFMLVTTSMIFGIATLVIGVRALVS